MDANTQERDPDFISRVLDTGSDGSVPPEVDGLDVPSADVRLSLFARSILAAYGIFVPATVALSPTDMLPPVPVRYIGKGDAR